MASSVSRILRRNAGSRVRHIPIVRRYTYMYLQLCVIFEWDENSRTCSLSPSTIWILPVV